MFKLANTNMLIESYHNLLKTKFMSGKRNRRIDRLIFILTEQIENHFVIKQKRKKYGLHGPSLVEFDMAAQKEKSLLFGENDI